LNEIFRDLGMLVNEQESGVRKFLFKWFGKAPLFFNSSF
jgi:hypothetical protein